MSEQASGGHYRDLDGLRGIMALVVLLHHFGLQGMLHKVTGGLPAEPAFGLAVDFFFVLSGLVLARSYSRRPRALGTRFVERVFRLLPVHAVMLFIALPLVLITGQTQVPISTPAVTSAGFVAELSGFYVYLFTDFPKWNGPGWSVSVELIVPVLLAAALPAAWRMGHTAILGLMAALIAVQGWLCYEHAFGIMEAMEIDYYLLMRGVVGLSLGGVIHLALTRRTIQVPVTRLFLPVATVLFIGLMVLCAWQPLLGWVIPFLIVAIVGGGTRSAGLLGMQPFTWLADHSFTIYMVHMPLWMYFQALKPVLGEGIAIKAGVLLLVFVGAALLTRFVERPGMALGKRLLSGRPPVTPGAA